MSCPPLVMKFGGTSVGDVARIRHSARHVRREVDDGRAVVVVVSAMAGETDRLAGLARSASALHDAREYDAIVSSGEQVSAALTAIALQSEGILARSWTGWQLPIRVDDSHASARILEVDVSSLAPRLAEGETAVVCGFQGVTSRNRTATLGRGGSDATAAALASALSAECHIYTDVDGVYTADPRVVPSARRLRRLAFEEMLELASQGAKVLQTRAVELAMSSGTSLRVRSAFAEASDRSASSSGTEICEEDEDMERTAVRGIAHSTGEAKVTLIGVSDRPGAAADVFGPLAEAGIAVDMIVQSVSADARHADITFTVPSSDLNRTMSALESLSSSVGFKEVRGSSGAAKVSAVGVGMRSHAGVAGRFFRALADRGINILAITTSEIKITALVDEDRVAEACLALHAAFDLETPSDRRVGL